MESFPDVRRGRCTKVPQQDPIGNGPPSDYDEAMSGVVHHTYEEGQLALDERYFPVVIATWSGTVYPDGVTQYYRWYDGMLQRAADEGVKLESITDGLDVGRVPSGIRARFIEQTNARAEEIRDHVDFVMVVAQRAFLLGFIASVLYRMRWGVRMSSFGDIRSALERAQQRMDAANLPRPTGFDPASYERPTSQQAVA